MSRPLQPRSFLLATLLLTSTLAFLPHADGQGALSVVFQDDFSQDTLDRYNHTGSSWNVQNGVLDVHPNGCDCGTTDAQLWIANLTFAGVIEVSVDVTFVQQAGGYGGNGAGIVLLEKEALPNALQPNPGASGYVAAYFDVWGGYRYQRYDNAQEAAGAPASSGSAQLGVTHHYDLVFVPGQSLKLSVNGAAGQTYTDPSHQGPMHVGLLTGTGGGEVTFDNLVVRSTPMLVINTVDGATLGAHDIVSVTAYGSSPAATQVAIQVTLDGQPVGQSVVAASGSIQTVQVAIDALSLGPGPHQLSARGWTDANSFPDAQPRAVFLVATPPTLTITSSTHEQGGTLRVTGTATATEPGIGMKSVTFSTPLGTNSTPCNGASPCSFNMTITNANLMPGSVRYTVVAADTFNGQVVANDTIDVVAQPLDAYEGSFVITMGQTAQSDSFTVPPLFVGSVIICSAQNCSASSNVNGAALVQIGMPGTSDGSPTTGTTCRSTAIVVEGSCAIHTTAHTSGRVVVALAGAGPSAVYVRVLGGTV
ncbi:MAG: hypothetical protein WDA16_03550 [Candidatus Thermoplasmatota archaeon]